MAAPLIRELPPAPDIYLDHQTYAALANAQVGAWLGYAVELTALSRWITDLLVVDSLPTVTAPATPNLVVQGVFARSANDHVAGWNSFATSINETTSALYALVGFNAPPQITLLPTPPSIDSLYAAFAVKAAAYARAWPAFSDQLNAVALWANALASLLADYAPGGPLDGLLQFLINTANTLYDGA